MVAEQTHSADGAQRAPQLIRNVRPLERSEEHEMTTDALDPRKVEEVTDKAIGYLSGAGVSALAYLGDRLGLYRALSEAGPSTSAELAAKARLHERWVREWLHGQAS